MFSQAILLSVLAVLAEARFGQEQLPVAAIQAVTSGGSPGAAATLAGSSISTILAAANPCAKLQKADEIIDQLGTGADAMAAAIGLVAAEQNFNPFNVKIPSICSDPTLPKTEALRGIIPLVDPAVVGSDIENAKSATSKTTPFPATGMSVAQVMAAQGFSNFTTKDLAGTAGTVAAVVGGAADVAASSAVSSDTAAATSAAATSAAAVASTSPCPTTMVTVTVTPCAAAATTAAADVVTSAAAAATTAAAVSSGNGTASTGSASTASSLGLDFGTCVPTIKFEAGLNGRKDTEFTFQAVDPVVNKGQQEALNPNIITNRICDQLTNVCGAAAAAKDACIAAKATISALGTRDKTTADAWNSALGFAGADTNPDNAPQAGLVGHS